MKRITQYSSLIMLAGILLASCSKSTVVPTLASINIVNASTDVPSIAVSFTLTPIANYQQQAVVGYGAASNYGESSGTVPLTLVSSSDTTHHIYQSNLSLGAGKIYSLYVYGNLPTIQTMLLTDNIPVHKDSVSGARFINLSPDAGPVNISLSGGSGNEFSALAYKSISAFKNYANTMSVVNNGGYNWQVTDASGNVLTTFNWNPQIFQNNTLVISGSEVQGTVQVFSVNNY